MHRLFILVAVVLGIHLLGLSASILQSGSARGGWVLWRRRLDGFSSLLGQGVLVLSYLLVIPFFVLPARWKDPLRVRSEGWIPRKTKDRSIRDAERQY